MYLKEKVDDKTQEQMKRICLQQIQPSRRNKPVEKIISFLLKNSKNSMQKTGRVQQIINLNISTAQTPRQSQDGIQNFIMACFVYMFIKFRKIRVTLNINPKNARNRKNDNSIRLCLPNKRSEIRLGSKFYLSVQKLMRAQENIKSKAAYHFEQIYFKCNDQGNNQGFVAKGEQIMKLRSDCFFFISQFFYTIDFLFHEKPMYLLRLTLNFWSLKNCRQQNRVCSSQLKKDLIKNVKVKNYFINLLCISHEELKQLFRLEQIKQEKQISSEHLCVEQQSQQESQEKLGYFMDFKGTQLQYLSKLYIRLEQINDLHLIQAILPKIPNITALKIINTKAEQIIIPQIDFLLNTLCKSNCLIEIFGLKNIRVRNISIQLLQSLYQQCPYLTELELNILFSYLLQETFQFKTPEQKELKESQRQIQIILKAMRLRYISLQNNLEMAKVLISQGYNMHNIIEIVDFIQPLCF